MTLAVLATVLPTWSTAAIGAQTGPQWDVRGRVTDAASGAPIVGALVRLLEANRADDTHTDGTFLFRAVASGSYGMRITRIGFHPETLSVRVRGGEPAPLAIVMRAAAVELATTVVTGTIRARDARDAVNPTTVLSGEQLDRQLQSTLAATLQNQPGMSITTLGPAAARPVIRGLSGDRVVVLEDGMRPGDLSSTSPDHAVTVDPLTTRQLEVVRGPMSLLYGSSALGGVINVIRDEVPVSLPEHLGATFGATGSSVDRGVGAGGTVTGRMGNLAYRAEGTARTAGDQHTPLGALDNTAADTYGASLGAAVVGGQGYVGASYRFFDNSYGVPGGFVGGHDNGVHINMQRNSARVEGELRPDTGVIASVHTSVGVTRYHHEEIEAGGSLGTRFAQTLAQSEIVARHRAMGGASEGAIGVRYQYRDIVTGGTLRTPSTYDQSAAAFVLEQFGTGAVQVLAGARYEWAQYDPYKRGAIVIVNGVAIPARRRVFSNGSGSLGVLYNADDAFAGALKGLRLGASLGRAYRTPDFNELYSNGPHLAAYSYDVGNPALRAETGLGVDVFARLTRDRLHGEVAVFRNHLRDYIFPRNTGDIGLQGNRPKFQYTGRDATLQGAEGGIEMNVARRWTANATVSYVQGDFVGNVDSLPADSANGDFSPRAGSQSLPLLPPLHGHLGLQYETGHASARNYSAGFAVRAGAEQTRLGDFETPSAGYGLLDFNVGARILVGGHFHAVTLRLENVLDHAWRNHLSRTKDVMPEAGRNVSLLYRVSI